MAKTYEAMVKGKAAEDDFAHLPLTDWAVTEFGDIEELGDLYQKIVNMESDARTFCFMGNREGEGVSTIIVNLVRHMVRRRNSSRVLVMDANPLHPVLHDALGKGNERGLRDLLANECAQAEAIQEVLAGRLYLLPWGYPQIDSFKGIDQKEFHALISRLAFEYDLILIDSPPLLSSDDALSIAMGSDAAFLVIDARRTHSEVAKKSKRFLEEIRCTIGGVILNRVQRPIPQWLYRIL